MNIIYLHGLDSNPNTNKACTTKQVANQYGIPVVVPDLNIPPTQVVQKVQALINKDSVLIGSSLGGYFANLLSDMTGVPCILLDPSIRPDVSFKRFLADKNLQNLDSDSIIYETYDGWQICYRDLDWFENHRLTVKNPNKINVLLKMGDELLDACATKAFYDNKGVTVHAFDGGDHRISNYDSYVDDVISWAKDLLNA